MTDVDTQDMNSNEEDISAGSSPRKRNARRRGKKKGKKGVDAEDGAAGGNEDSVTEVVNFLCNSLSKASEEVEEVDGAQSVATSTELPDLHNLLENLQLHAANNPIKHTNVTEFLNVDLLKKTNAEVLKFDELEKMKQEKQKKSSSPVESIPIPQEKMKDYFNLNLIQNTPEKSILRQIEVGSMTLVSELESSFLPKDSAKPAKKNVDEYFNIHAKDNLMNSMQAVSQVLVNELQRTVGQSAATGVGTKGNAAKKTNTQKQGSSAVPKESYKFPSHLPENEIKRLSTYGIIVTAAIRINQRNFREAYICAPDNGMDIVIDGVRDRNRALEGDEVYVITKPQGRTRTDGCVQETQRTAIVVGIKEMKHNRTAVGTLRMMQDNNPKFALFSPRDSRLPRIRIPCAQWPADFKTDYKSYADRLFVAKIKQWDDIRHADGDLVNEIGTAGDIAAETEALLLNCNLDTTPYPDSFKEFYPATPYQIPEDVLAQREDLRAECVFTIDPATARDLDDAVSLKKLTNGHWEVGVHISDVTFFLAEGTPLDVAVSARATTVYLVQETHHMLPRDLCLMCSLTPGEDKLSISVFCEVTPDLEIVSHRFARTVINSCAQLSYEQVQQVLEGAAADSLAPFLRSHSSDRVGEAIMVLNQLAVKLRLKRFANGSLRIDQVKISFRLKEDGYPDDYTMYINKDAHRLIEELMLLANMTTAKHIEKNFPRLAFLRSHPNPLQYVLEKTCTTMEKFGIILNHQSSGALQASLQRYYGDDETSLARILVLSNLLAKSMSRARYFCSSPNQTAGDRHHYALNVPLYTHFTSPIRRYADIMVHRLLTASLGYTDHPRWTPDFVQRVASTCNCQKYNAKLAGDASCELFLAVWVEMRGVVVESAVVCDLKDKSFDCIVLSTGTIHRVYYEQIPGMHHLQTSDVFSLRVVWPADPANGTPVKTQIIEMFSLVRVALRRASPVKLEAQLIQSNTLEAPV